VARDHIEVSIQSDCGCAAGVRDSMGINGTGHIRTRRGQ
jgi:hypothetical protein